MVGRTCISTLWHGHNPIWLRRHSTRSTWNSGNKAIDTPTNRDLTVIEKFSSFTRMKRIIAYCLRFKNNASRNTTKAKGPLTIAEISNAVTAIIKTCQAKEFPRELHSLTKQLQLDSKSKLLNLHPFLDSSGIIRVGGRLHHAPIEYGQRHPIILPSKNHITNLIIKDIHYKNLHAGPQAILAIMRESY